MPQSLLTTSVIEQLIDSFPISSPNGSIISFGDSVKINILPRTVFISKEDDETSVVKEAGKVKVSLTLVKTKGDFISSNLPIRTNTGVPLDFVAFFRVRFIFKGKEIFLSQDSNKPSIILEIKDNKTVVAGTGLQFFSLRQQIVANKDTQNLWFPVPFNKNSLFILTDTTNPNATGYAITCKMPGWIACAKPLFGNSQTTVRANVSLPINFTNKNTVVIAVLDNSKTVLRLVANPSGKTFTVGNLPLNANITFISLSKIDQTNLLGVKKTNTPFSNSLLNIMPEPKTSVEIIKYLKGL